MTYQNTFKRHEKKYLLDASQYRLLRERLDAHLVQDAFGLHTICNLYYDTPDFAIILKSLEKPVYKEKLRIRSYGVPGRDDPVFLELKKKYQKIVYKRRLSMPLREVQTALSDPEPRDQILREIQWFQKIHQTAPRIYIAYERLAFKGILDPTVRVTFDSGIRYRMDDLDLSKGDHGTPIIQPGQRLMEIKVIGAMPLWLSAALTELKIYPQSFSKYGRCYQDLLLAWVA